MRTNLANNSFIIALDIKHREEKTMSENSNKVRFNKPKIHLIARGELGKNVLLNLSLPKRKGVFIEYLENDTPAQKFLSNVDLVIEISDQFNQAVIEQTQYQSDMVFVIGGTMPNSKGIIQRKGDFYFVHSNSIEDYRLLISTIINMLHTPSFFNVNLSDIKDVFNEGSYGFITGGHCLGDNLSNRAKILTEEVLENLTKQISDLQKVKSCLVSIVGEDLTLGEFYEIGHLNDNLGDEANIVVGTYIKPKSQGISVSVIMMM